LNLYPVAMSSIKFHATIVMPFMWAKLNQLKTRIWNQIDKKKTNSLLFLITGSLRIINNLKWEDIKILDNKYNYNQKLLKWSIIKQKND